MPAQRKSPRLAFQRLNSGLTPRNLSHKQTSLVLALSHQSGWSADQIGLSLMKTKLMKDTTRIQAENLWTFFNKWVAKRGGNTTLTSEEQTTMTTLLEEAGINLAETGSPLNYTVRPTTVIYNTISYTPDERDATFLKAIFGIDIIMATDQPAQDSPGLIPSFTSTMRAENRKELMELNVTEEVLLANLTAREIAVVELFGEPMKVIFTSIMKRWARAVRHQLQRPDDRHGLRALKKSQYTDLIMEYAAEYDSAYETKFGKAETTHQQNPEEGKPITLVVASTALAGKILLALMMADRLEAADNLRRKRREELQFVHFEVEDFKKMDDDVDTSCFACALPYGDAECVPIQMVACCFQVCCESCTKEWIDSGIVNKGMKNVACPICRHEFSDNFIEKLMPGKKKNSQDENGDEEDDEDSELSDDEEHQVSEPEVATSGEIPTDGGPSDNVVDGNPEVLPEQTIEVTENTPATNSVEDVQDLSQVGENVQVGNGMEGVQASQPAGDGEHVHEASEMEGVQSLSQQVIEDVQATTEMEGVQESQPEGSVVEEIPDRSNTPDNMTQSGLLGEGAIPLYEPFSSPYSPGVAVRA